MLSLHGNAMTCTDYTLLSPNKKIEIKVHMTDRVEYDVLFKGIPLLKKATFSMDIDHKKLGAHPNVLNHQESTQDTILEPAVRQKYARIHDHYNELRLNMKGNYAVVFRAYNEGIAYHLETSLPEKEVKIYNERANFNFTENYIVYYPQEKSFMSHNERLYLPVKMASIKPTSIASLPAVVDVNGIKVALAESDLEEYPGLWLQGTHGNGLAITHPPYPLKETLYNDRDLKVTQGADYIAITRGTRTYPWRIVGIAEKDGDLITNQLVYLLAKPSQIQNTSWIKPGKVVWDWWNDLNIDNVDFKSGVNTQTYKYYIDFAAKYGIPYVLIDEGWYKLGDVMSVIPAVNMEELSTYAKQKNVGLILWVVWKSFNDQFYQAFDQFQKWGIKGIKLDFMQRNDQKLIDFYIRVCREAAKRKMLINFHGSQSQITMTRTWPNMITGEGVLGMEWSKINTNCDPNYDLRIPFTRMFLGPMDYTPGAMINATKTTFSPSGRPMAMGTRCHQLAMYVVFESPMQMLADSPSNYLREPEAMEFLTQVPTVWDETRVLDAKLGEYVLLARRSGKDWYIGSMTNWTARHLDVNLSFLPAGKFSMDFYQDGVNADRNPSDYKKIQTQVSHDQILTISMAPGGGWVAHIRE